MQKILVFLMLTIINTYADIEVIANKLSQTDTLISKQDYLAGSVNICLAMTGNIAKCDSTAELISGGYIANNFAITETTTIANNSTNKTITLTSTVSPWQEQKDYFLTSMREEIGVPSISGSNFVATYAMSSDAIKSVLAYLGGILVSTSAPSSPSVGATWLNPLTGLSYSWNGSAWVSTNIQKLWILRSTIELPTSGMNTNDLALIVTTTSMNKYQYNGSSWVNIDTVNPFTYNGQF